MSAHCELCRHHTLEQVYEPERSGRGLKVYLCQHCGLVQSLPRIDRASRAPAAVSGGADWGNVRYGKGFRTQAALSAIEKHADLNSEMQLLDVGSNRGSFAKAFLDAAPNAHVTAVEPDERVVQSAKDFPRTEIVHARIEDAALQTGRYDIVHSCHTIEHLGEPLRVLADHWRVLKPGGILVLDAPNIALLDADDIVEEWFIDKHLYHFSARTLMRMVTAAGFEVIAAPDLNDRENLLIVARKAYTGYPAIASDPREVEEAEARMANYAASRARNMAALTAVAAEISGYATRGVAMWGAGRLFDSLVVHGGFQPELLSVLIDKHLKKHVAERHGRALAGPEDLAGTKPGVVIVMSRGFAGEIVDEARRLAPGAEIVLYSELMQRARLQRAA